MERSPPMQMYAHSKKVNKTLRNMAGSQIGLLCKLKKKISNMTKNNMIINYYSIDSYSRSASKHK